MRRNILPGEILHYLHRVLTLATVSGGAPQAAALFYVADDQGRLYFLSAPGSRHSRNLAADNRVAVTIQGEVADWRQIQGLQIEGVAGPVTDPEEQTSAARLYRRRFPELAELPAMSDEQGSAVRGALEEAVLYCVVPHWIRWIDNTQAFGHKEEWTSAAGDGSQWRLGRSQ